MTARGCIHSATQGSSEMHGCFQGLTPSAHLRHFASFQLRRALLGGLSSRVVCLKHLFCSAVKHFLISLAPAHPAILLPCSASLFLRRNLSC